MAPLSIDEERARALIVFAIQGMTVILIISPIIGGMMWRFASKRRGTFVAVTAFLYITFIFTFYGLNFLMRHVWLLEPAWGSNGIHGVALAVALTLILILAVPLRIAFNEEISPLQAEFNKLPSNMMTPMDHRRRAEMAKRARRKGKF